MELLHHNNQLPMEGGGGSPQIKEPKVTVRGILLSSALWSFGRHCCCPPASCSDEAGVTTLGLWLHQPFEQAQAGLGSGH